MSAQAGGAQPEPARPPVPPCPLWLREKYGGLWQLQPGVLYVIAARWMVLPYDGLLGVRPILVAASWEEMAAKLDRQAERVAGIERTDARNARHFAELAARAARSRGA